MRGGALGRDRAGARAHHHLITIKGTILAIAVIALCASRPAGQRVELRVVSGCLVQEWDFALYSRLRLNFLLRLSSVYSHPSLSRTLLLSSSAPCPVEAHVKYDVATMYNFPFPDSVRRSHTAVVNTRLARPLTLSLPHSGHRLTTEH